MLVADLATTSNAIASTSSRLEKVQHIATALRTADPHEVGIVVFYLAGELRQRRTGLGYAALRALPPPAATPTLEVTEVDAAFERIAGLSGPGSQARRRQELEALGARATHAEQRLLAGLITGELRQGALEGVMTDAVIAASALPAADVRRAVMLAGAIAPVAEAALADGAAGVERFRLQAGQPVRPMLASSAPDVSAAFDRIQRTGGDRDGAGRAGVEWKLDGVRVQIHLDHGRVRVFTRTLEEITDRLPEVVDAIQPLPARTLVLDAEAIALDENQRPRPFQVTASRMGSRSEVARLRVDVPLTVFAFDLLHLDGEDLLAEPGERRWAAMERVLPESLRVPRVVTSDQGVASQFFDDAVDRGHEGVIVKAPDAGYEAGRRGSGWVKVKPRHTLDLIVLAAEWGHGRRTGSLSNLHLGARDAESGTFVMLGKTFKGLTDEMLRWQTERLLELAERRDRHTVYVRPELVVEVAFDGVQTSSRYPGGMALRFARVLRHRTDKSGDEVDTVQTVSALHSTATGGFGPDPADGDPSR